jgi:hypothetical protein
MPVKSTISSINIYFQRNHEDPKNDLRNLLGGSPAPVHGALTLLQINFEYTDILRQPAATVLEKFAAGGSSLVANWYAMLVSAIFFIPIAVLLHPFLTRKDVWYLPLATVFGVLAGVVQMLGFVRWAFQVPV